MRLVIYDAEIKKGILKRGEEPIPGIEYCDGWRDFKNMGVSTVCCYDYGEYRYRIFCADNFDEMIDLFNDADILVSFNGIGFDDHLLSAAVLGFDDVVTARYDLLAEIWRAAGLDPTKFVPSTHGGYGLDAMCEANFGIGKTGHGAMAPVDWQRGKIGKVIDYCVQDIKLTGKLLDQVISGQPLKNPKGEPLKLRYPSDVFEEFHDELAETLQAGSAVPAFGGEDAGHDPDYRQGKLRDREAVEEEPAKVDVDALRQEQASKTFPAGNLPPEERYLWDNILVEIDPHAEQDKVIVAVHTNDGEVIKRKLALHEWSCETMNTSLIEKDGPTLVAYLKEHEALYERIGDESGTA